MTYTDTLIAARRALRLSFGSRFKLELDSVVVDYPDSGSIILSCTTSGVSRLPREVIVKRPRKPDGHLFYEWTCLQFLDSIPELSVGIPRFLGGDLKTQTMVMADLKIKEEDRLGRILDEKDSDLAEKALHEFCVSLAKLHGATMRKRQGFEEFLGRYPRGTPSRHRVHQIPNALIVLPEILKTVGIKGSPDLDGELRAAVEELERPGPFMALGHGDATPTNAYYKDGTITLFDFESGGFRHALLDGCFPVMRYLHSVWARGLPWKLQRALMRTYRTELGKSNPIVLDDSFFAHSLLSCSAGWLAGLCCFLPGALEEDTRWGRCSHRQRIVAAMDHFAKLSRDFGGFPVLADVAFETGKKLRALWPESDCAVSLYTAFGGPAP